MENTGHALKGEWRPPRTKWHSWLTWDRLGPTCATPVLEVDGPGEGWCDPRSQQKAVVKQAAEWSSWRSSLCCPLAQPVAQGWWSPLHDINKTKAKLWQLQSQVLQSEEMPELTHSLQAELGTYGHVSLISTHLYVHMYAYICAVLLSLVTP